MSTIAAGLIFAITCTTGAFQSEGQPLQEMCVVQFNGVYQGMYMGSCNDVGEAMYKDALRDGKSPTLVVNGYDYNKV